MTKPLITRLQTLHDRLQRIAGDLSFWQEDIRTLAETINHMKCEYTVSGSAVDVAAWVGVSEVLDHRIRTTPLVQSGVNDQPAPGECPECHGTGKRDSGGTHPWGEAVMVPCEHDPEAGR